MRLTRAFGHQALLFLNITLFAVSSAAFAEDSESKSSKTETAIFAGGCFWCMEPPFDKLDGVISTTSGYTSGHQKNPTYKQVSAGTTGHTEAIEIVYDPKKVSYEKLLEVFWINIDPLNGKGQFCDFGSQYRTGIFYVDDNQQKLAEESREEIIKKLGKPVVTEITAATEFYPAEDYHQNYYQVNPVRYNYYRWSCGRDQQLKELWGKQASH
ncbi:MAG: peptide-methionine (S)-S-oxide reductase MsrA [Pseudomonadota bacterium]|nr:peptide-methionine (S)-S-oxide reductase MsrA [Pseudomonadota bacterium]